MRSYRLLTHPHHSCILVAFSPCSDLPLYLIGCIHSEAELVVFTLSLSTGRVYLGKKTPRRPVASCD